jgi:CO/xanthine dehydrogenase Mo-binding subunit
MYFSMGRGRRHLQWPLNKLKFVGGTVGRGFGGQGRHGDRDDRLAARAQGQAPGQVALHARGGVPDLLDARAVAHRAQDAVTNDGWILGRRTLTLHDAGAYARFSPYGVTKHAFHHTGAYTIPNLRFDGFVRVHQPRADEPPCAGFGVTSVSLAVEMHMSRVAEQLGISPLELRLRNANRIGDTTGNRVVMHDPSTVPVVLGGGRAAGSARRRATAR